MPILGVLPTSAILGTGEMIPQNNAPKPCAIFLKLIFPTHFSKNKNRKKKKKKTSEYKASIVNFACFVIVAIMFPCLQWKTKLKMICWP